MQDRTLLRQQMRSHRQSLAPEIQQASSHAIANLVIKSDVFQNSQHIAGYMASQGEIDPTPIFEEAWKLGKKCYLPVIQPDKKMVFVRYEFGDELTPNRYHILEPKLNSAKIINPQELDLILVPLVAFDLKGNRLGMGSGFYDFNFAFLQNKIRPSKPFLIGLGYNWQCCENIFPEDWDISLDVVVTEKKIYKI